MNVNGTRTKPPDLDAIRARAATAMHTETINGSPFADRRERLRRAAEDGERLFRVRMHAPDEPTIADDNRIDGILTLDLVDALGLVDELADKLRRVHPLDPLFESARSPLWHPDDSTDPPCSDPDCRSLGHYA